MSRGRGFFLCALAALSPVLIASEGETRAPAGTKATEAVAETVVERGAPALSTSLSPALFTAIFSWGDADGDGRLDLAAVSLAGKLQLLISAGDDRFEDVTEQVGLGQIENATLASWADYDGDGRLDLFVGAQAGASSLFHNEGGTFTEMSAGCGLSCEGAVQSAQWLDHDGDGRLDLFVVLIDESGNAVSSRLFRGLEGGYFERVELPFSGSVEVPGLGGPWPRMDEEDAGVLGAPLAPRSPGGKGRPSGRSQVEGASADDLAGSSQSQGRIALGSPSIPYGLGAQIGCANSIVDQAKAGACIQGSSLPALGKLYPLSNNLFVAVGGNVGIGTTNPTAKLHVAGSARVTDKLTLAPSGDTALDVSTGSIYKAGALFLHTKGGAGNTALGNQALGSVTSGFQNTAEGYRALFSNTTGERNTASGSQALSSNTNGDGNTASGAFALFTNTTGGFNTASGYGALYSNTSGSGNTAIGDSALVYNTTGFGNTASGARGLALNTTGSNNTASGESALFSNTIGAGNTAGGAFALSSNTTGAFNTASGYGALYSNTVGSGNTASGDSALAYNTTGNGNTASGARGLAHNTTGNDNTASGDSALFSNTTGKNNTASGIHALHSNTTGSGNAAHGRKALYSNTSGINNTASGNAALFYNTTGAHNIALGAGAGLYLTTGSANITIGNYGLPGDTATTRIGAVQTRTFIAGIRGAATGIANAIPVLIDSAGQLGTTFSSRRFKQDIRDMDDATERLLELRPVLFRYKQEQTLPGNLVVPPEYGLIAEEVAEIFPDLVVYDEEGKPLTVKYHLLGAMLLNELKKLSAEHAREMGDLRRRLAALEAQLR
ncbi:MAG: hypothetical protein HOP15_01420 [Planctomycetes bacterium]|nr:hypothetical protein [Planctomycetota bacterium]